MKNKEVYVMLCISSTRVSVPEVALDESLPEGITWEEDGDVYQSTIEIGGNFSVGNIEIAEDKGWQVKGAETNSVNAEIKQKSKRVKVERK